MPSEAVITFKVPSFDHPDEKRGRREIVDSVRGIMDGKINTAIDIQLELAPAVQTVVEDPRVSQTSRIVLSGGNSAGQADLNSGTLRVVDDNIEPGRFTIQHVPFALERRLRAVILG